MHLSGNSRELIELERAYWRAMQQGDVDAALELTEDTCLVARPNGCASVDKKDLAGMMKRHQWKLLSFDFIDEPIVRFITPDIGALAYKIREELVVEGKPVALETADTSIWTRRDGKWRCSMHTESLLGDSYGRDRVGKSPAAGKLAEQDAVANLAVKDLEAARRFYENTVGLTPVRVEGDEVVVYRSGHSTVNVYRSQYAGTNQATSVTWHVGDVDSTVNDLKSKGVRFEHYDMPHMKHEGDVYSSSDMRVAWFKDPDGNILNVVSQ